MPRSPRWLAALLLVLAACATPVGSGEISGNSWLAHDVYFELKDDSVESCQALVDACWRELAEIDGIRFFATGTRAPGLEREVNDLGFDVSLHIVFENRAAHDAYQTDPRHEALVDAFAQSWASVRVFDSIVDARVDP